MEGISDCPPKFWRLHGLSPADDIDLPGSSLLMILPNHDGLFNYAKPLASRGRLLHLVVCHPLLGGMHHVPPPPMVLHPPFQGRDVTGYSLITGHGGESLDNKCQRRLAFRVLFTAVRLDEVVDAYPYSSATDSWSTPIMCPRKLRGLTMCGPRDGVVDDRGTAHWLYRDALYFYTLEVSADAARVSLAEIPILVECEHERRLMQTQPPFPCIAQGGKLSFVSIRQPDGNMLKFCMKRDQDDNNKGWRRYQLPRSLHLRDPFIQMSFVSFKIIGFVEGRGALLVRSYSGVFFLDLESRELELIKGSIHHDTSPTYP
jgi:hypothetical protein